MRQILQFFLFVTFALITSSAALRAEGKEIGSEDIVASIIPSDSPTKNEYTGTSTASPDLSQFDYDTYLLNFQVDPFTCCSLDTVVHDDFFKGIDQYINSLRNVLPNMRDVEIGLIDIL